MSISRQLSERGIQAAKNPVRVDLELLQKAFQNKYHPIRNPDGDMPMTVAENHLCWEILKEKLEQVSRNQEIPEWVASYGDPRGVLPFREAIANFFSKYLFHIPVHPDSLAISGGATSVIEMTAFLLANPGDTAVIPAPSYPVYRQDIGVIPGVLRYDLQLHSGMPDSLNVFHLSIDQLESAKIEIEKSGSDFRMLILTTPDNPTGLIYREENLKEIAEWCISQEIHLIVNEIYGLSRIDINHPELREDYPHPVKFVSFGRLMAEKKSPFLHLWYSFSKDMGISGFRVGVLHSHHEELIKGYKNTGLTHAISNHTQWLLTHVLEDAGFMQEFISCSQKALTTSYLMVIRCLRKLNVPYHPSYGSLFVWLDFSEFLDEDSDQGQHALWMELFEKTGILITPGVGFGHQKKGLFRMVISGVDHETLTVVLERIEAFVEEKRSA